MLKARSKTGEIQLKKISMVLAMAFASGFPMYSAAALDVAQTQDVAQQANAEKSDKKQPVKATEPAQALDVVVITANKRIEKLENVPLSISVVSEEKLGRYNIRDLDDLVNFSPAISKTEADAPSNTSLNMRGIGTQSIGIGVESDVAVILDDVPIALGFQAFRDLADVQRIEILKGPQSTLFGKSAVAGAINIVTKPISGPIAGTTSVLKTSDHEWKVAASIGGNLSDKFGFRIAASQGRWAGNIHNLTTDSMTQGSASKSVVVKLSWHPTENIDIDFSPRYNYTLSTCCTLAITGTGTLDLATATLGSTNNKLLVKDALAGITPSKYNVDVRNDYFTGQISTTRGASLRATYNLPSGASVVSITSADRWHSYDAHEQDYTDLPVLQYYSVTGSTKLSGLPGGADQWGTMDIDSKTQEFRFVSPDVGNFKYVAGLWYAKNEIARYFKRGVFGVLATNPTELNVDTYNVNKAIYGQSSWEFAPTYSLTTGARYNVQESGFHFHGAGNPSTLPFGSSFVALNNFESVGNKEGATTGKLSLQKQFTPSLMAYASASTGYKGKAYDTGSSLSAVIAAQMPIKAETAKSFEIGMKGNFLDNKLTVAGSIYNAKFFDYQQSSGGFIPGANGTLIYVTFLNSVPGVQTKGGDIDVNALVTKNLLADFSFAYTNATVTEFKNMSCYTGQTAAQGCVLKNPLYGNANTQDISGMPMPFAPKRKANLGFKYTVVLSDLSFDAFLTGSGSYVSDVVTNLNQDPVNHVNPKVFLNAGFGIKDKAGRYTLSFRVTNLADKHYSAREPLALTGITGSTSWSPRRDDYRYYTVRLDTKF